MRLFAASINTEDVIVPVYGCTDPLADNYNPLATVDDGSCTYLTEGSFTFPVTFPINFT